MTEFRFMVDGLPASQGSKNGYFRNGRVVLVEANKKLPAWRSAVELAAKLELLERQLVKPFVGPVKLVVTFFLPRPGSTKWGRYPAGKPDLSKLLRAVEDSLTDAGVWSDDALVVELVARKLWCGSSTDSYPSPGCLVFVTDK